MENLDQGLDDIRFVDVVDEDLHCAICLNVLKEPVQCQNNEHHFCRSCIERHFNNFQTCPSCMEGLTLETVRKPARYLTKQLLKLLIHCEYVDRGCAEVVQLEHLQTHIDICGFAPVVCSNDGCGLLMNKHERVHHETEDCSYRKVNWIDYDDVRKERDEMKTRLDELNDQMRRMTSEMKHPRSSTRDQLAADACNVTEDIFTAGGKTSNSIYQLLLVPSYSCELKSQMVQRRSYHGAVLVDKIVILGGSTTGWHKNGIASVEMYDICRNESKQMPPLPFALCGMATVSWGDSVVLIGGQLQTDEVINTVLMYNVHGDITMLPSMKHKRVGCSAIITGNRIVVMGGKNVKQGYIISVECFSFDTYSWEELPPLIEARAFATAVVKPAV